ncbi:Uncharacterised protein [BD1-7 clade bacterium]|uniref:Phage tail assembly chaperone-like domain-containing protein n=1 Tax=BD1-7 clade bacterium TaxID=2029982 RepID=A0A5S9QWG4_9GAMM|nr:Uncharacterised protein [BD1-7 clade bacterium]CAA0122829.1 Uncharacterised protein [BD1-7 clade bacterium]
MEIPFFEFNGKKHYGLNTDDDWSVRGVSDANKQIVIVDCLWKAIRTQRNQHLATSDWTQTPDTPLSAEIRAEWATYRQALRDITITFTDPDAIVWPPQPA